MSDAKIRLQVIDKGTTPFAITPILNVVFNSSGGLLDNKRELLGSATSPWSLVATWLGACLQSLSVPCSISASSFLSNP